MDPIRLLLIEDHAAVRRALELRLRSSQRIELVAAADDLQTGKKLARAARPDVVLLGCKGGRSEELQQRIGVIREQAAVGVPVILLASYADDVEREALLKAGASSYLLKDINTPQLIAEIELVWRRQGGGRGRHGPPFPVTPSRMHRSVRRFRKQTH